jgi:hypothetical protein
MTANLKVYQLERGKMATEKPKTIARTSSTVAARTGEVSTKVVGQQKKPASGLGGMFRGFGSPASPQAPRAPHDHKAAKSASKEGSTPALPALRLSGMTATDKPIHIDLSIQPEWTIAELKTEIRRRIWLSGTTEQDFPDFETSSVLLLKGEPTGPGIHLDADAIARGTAFLSEEDHYPATMLYGGGTPYYFTLQPDLVLGDQLKKEAAGFRVGASAPTTKEVKEKPKLATVKGAAVAEFKGNELTLKGKSFSGREFSIVIVRNPEWSTVSDLKKAAFDHPIIKGAYPGIDLIDFSIGIKSTNAHAGGGAPLSERQPLSQILQWLGEGAFEAYFFVKKPAELKDTPPITRSPASSVIKPSSSPLPPAKVAAKSEPPKKIDAKSKFWAAYAAVGRIFMSAPKRASLSSPPTKRSAEVPNVRIPDVIFVNGINGSGTHFNTLVGVNKSWTTVADLKKGVMAELQKVAVSDAATKAGYDWLQENTPVMGFSMSEGGMPVSVADITSIEGFFSAYASYSVPQIRIFAVRQYAPTGAASAGVGTDAMLTSMSGAAAERPATRRASVSMLPPTVPTGLALPQLPSAPAAVLIGIGTRFSASGPGTAVAGTPTVSMAKKQ